MDILPTLFQLATMNSVCTDIYSFFSRLVYINLFLCTYNKNLPIIVVIKFPSFEILWKIMEYGNRLINRAKQTKIWKQLCTHKNIIFFPF